MSFSSILPSSLTQRVDELNTLVLDIRPHAAYSSARIPHAIPLSVPSTLLKRPLFSLQRLAAMLPSTNARTRFLAWPSASRILVYDADSQVAGESSNITGLLRKFKLDGFEGELTWLQGGFQAAWRDCRDIIDTRPPSPDPETEDDADVHDKSSQPSLLRTRRLPMAAFSLSSTAIHNSPSFNSTGASPIKRPSTVSQHSLSNPATSNSHHAYNPFFDTIRQNTELSHGITERIPLRLPRRVRRRIRDLPFPWLQNIAHRAASTPLHHRSFNESTSSDSSEDYESNEADIEEGKESLAMQFFKIELAEQRRLMGVMEHHSNESGQSGKFRAQGNTFPFSITAGIEKGAKNRYRHVWPFEHARVRLHQKREADDDYVNASYIQPLVTTKRYIATQGPLPATFTDFWTLCWEQNVHVIVMLTREVEGATIKCGAYWIGTAFGPLRLRLVSLETPPAPADQRPTSAGFFTQLSVPSSRQIPHSAGSKCHRPQHYTTDPRETVKRVFELTHTDYPDAKPRKIVQLQYLGWQDMNVPDDPRSLLGLIKQVEDAVEETHSARDLSKIENRDHIMNEVDQCTGIAKHALGDSPVLLHCSAGVGRTGGFIAVDSILDAIRREIRAERKPDDMDVDSSDQPPRILTSPAFRLKTPIPLNNGIDIPHRAPMFTTTSDTVLWAQNVKAEIGVADSQQNLQHSNHPVSQPSKSSPSFFLSSESQSSQSHVYENYHRSSSSLDTPVSGTLPPCKVSSTPDHHTDGQRPTMQPFPPSTISRNSETPSRPSSRLLEPCTLTERSRMTQGLNQGLSSDGEPPSRSQSPSADEANTSQTPPSRDSILASSHRLIATSTPFSLIKPFDYKEPRLLHKDVTPPNLTSFEDPIWEVVQDMREQRMSLCQTLRQYVFVHAAIIEGALMVLDDEKMVKNGLAMPVPRTTSPASSLRSVVPSETTSLAASNKRGASPTELLKENKAGDVMLSKRPSMKRKQAKEDDIIANARYRPVVTLTPLRIAGPLHSVGTSAASTRSMPP